MTESVEVKAVVRVKLTTLGFVKNLGINQGLDGVAELLLQDAFQLELVSTELDPRTPGLEKQPIKGKARRAVDQKADEEVKYEARFSVPPDFGEIGAILAENERRTELFLRDIVLTGLPYGKVIVTCDSWVHSKFDNPQKRIFFTNKSYLPSQTPGGLKRLREIELQNLRGNGKGERKTFDRIYDYDKYNDLGYPDFSLELKRPVLGGKEHPYPRRCRTGRPLSKKDPLSETTSINFYVPRDEKFADVKEISFSVNTLSTVLHALVPTLEAAIVDTNLGFTTFAAIDALFKDGIELPRPKNQKNLLTLLPDLLQAGTEAGEDLLLFTKPEIVERDEFSWIRDEEFARQTVAGVNPCSIELLKEWPLKSKLDPEIYGPPESAITTELIEQQIKGYMTLEEAIQQKKIYILDYHDVFLPYVNKVRQIKGTTLYGSRTLFFLTLNGTLKPLAIELTRPPSCEKPQWKQVFTPDSDATQFWLWKLAKVHVLAHDSAHHQLISHWLRTHCAVEPYIIAANRQLSAAHPIYRLLYPHFRYTMEINALAREALINAEGTIETSFSARKYCMELSSVIYDQSWRFDSQGLPADLISRGLAVEDPSAPHGLKLTIEDYPFANDGLILWDAIKEWVADYINHYYQEDGLIESDQELTTWWAEIRNKGHEDKKDEPWWPILKIRQDLIEIATSMIWVSSAHHAAVNFVQYTYAGYFPNRPTIARNKMPTEHPTDKEWNMFLDKPHQTLLESFPSQIQATKVMAVLHILSTHSPDEEYIGAQMEPSWAEDLEVKAAFERFHRRLKSLEEKIDERNADKNLKNRRGAGIVSYEVLKPFSKPGLTGMGVPNSISI
ncbi:Linoleate 13S-lipoxygenase 2-1, chloroplastic-like protein [Drosera capensis]